MNKTLAVLASLAVMGSAADCMAAAVVNMNNYDANFPIMFTPDGTTAPVPAAAATTYVELLGGAAGGAQSAALIGGGTTSIIQGIDDGGFFDKGFAVIPGLADKAQADLTLQAWTGAATYDAATLKGQVQWTQATGAWNSTAVPPATPDNVVLALPKSVTIGPSIPEPSTIALGLLGAAALLLRRRK